MPPCTSLLIAAITATRYERNCHDFDLAFFTVCFLLQIQNAQDNAKSAKKRVWKDYVESEAVEAVEEQEKKEMDSERKVSLLFTF